MELYDPWPDRLSEYLDGDLGPADRTALEAHLAGCAECRETLDELRALILLAGQLEDEPPELDLWPAIQERLGGNISTREWWQRRWARKISFSPPQLAAACIAFALLAGGAAWFLAPGGGSLGPASGTRVAASPVVRGGAAPESGLVQSGAGEGGASIGVKAVHLTSELAGPEYDAAVADLERTLAEGRGRLAPATIEILEKYLAIIDRAIEDARNAIAEDPANLYLTNYLTDTMKRKLDLLRYTNSIVRAQS
jgi:hypothetical protein